MYHQLNSKWIYSLQENNERIVDRTITIGASIGWLSLSILSGLIAVEVVVRGVERPHLQERCSAGRQAERGHVEHADTGQPTSIRLKLFYIMFLIPCVALCQLALRGPRPSSPSSGRLSSPGARLHTQLLPRLAFLEGLRRTAARQRDG